MTRRPPRGYRAVAAVVRLGMRLLRWRVDARGFEHVPLTGGAVLTWNHTGHLDVVPVAVPLLARTGRHVRFLVLRELFDARGTGTVLRLLGCLPVERDGGDDPGRAFDAATAALAAGELVMVAPEGTISPSGELLPLRTGAVRLAQAAGVPIVPTVSWGTQLLVTTGRAPTLRAAWRLSVVARVGMPFTVGTDDDPAAATEDLRRRTAELLVDARTACSGDRLYG